MRVTGGAVMNEQPRAKRASPVDAGSAELCSLPPLALGSQISDDSNARTTRGSAPLQSSRVSELPWEDRGEAAQWGARNDVWSAGGTTREGRPSGDGCVAAEEGSPSGHPLRVRPAGRSPSPDRRAPGS